MSHTVGRRLIAEFTGTGSLVAIVVGSGIAATSLTTDPALRLLINSLVTAMGLAVTIGRSLSNTYAGIAPSSVPAFIAAQIVGGTVGTLLAVVVHPVHSSQANTETQTQLAG